MDVRGGNEQLTQQANQPAEPEQRVLEIPGEMGCYIHTNMLHLGKVGDAENILCVPPPPPPPPWSLQHLSKSLLRRRLGLAFSLLLAASDPHALRFLAH